MKVIFILGSGHCGSTLLDLILDSHSKIIGLGQCEKIGTKDTCACGKSFSDCGFWKNVVDYQDDFYKSQVYGVYRSKKDFLFNKNNYFLKTKNKEGFSINDYITGSKEMFKKTLQASGAEVVVDSSKNTDRVELLAKDKDIEPIILHLVRDGRGVVWSYFRKNIDKKKRFPYMWKWFVMNIKAEFLRKRNNMPYVFINYSGLINNPEAELKKIIKKTGLDYEPSMLKFRRSEHHQAAGNRMRMGGSEDLKEDMEWKKKLSLKHKLIFNLLFGWLNFYYKIKK